jgi:DNA polymerase elongation subunit (family B)
MAGRTFQLIEVVAMDTDRPGLWPDERRQRKWGEVGRSSGALALFGRTVGGESISVIVRGLDMTMHVRLPPEDRPATYDLDGLPQTLVRQEIRLRAALRDLGNGWSVKWESHTPVGEYGSGCRELFLAVRCQTSGLFYRARDTMVALGYDVVGPGRIFLKETVLMADLGWEMSSLLRLSDNLPPRALPGGAALVSSCTHEVWLTRDDLPEMLAPAEDQLQSAQLVVASFDIEASAPGGGFPNADNPPDAIVSIGIHYGRSDNPGSDRAVVLCLDRTGEGWGDATLAEPGEVDAGRHECLPTEAALLDRFAELIVELDVDVFTGYNIYGFDWKYIWDRAQLVGADGLRHIGRLKGLESSLVEKALSSSALGDNMIYFVGGLGRLSIDMMHQIRPNYKFASYTLESVSQHLLGGDGKKPMAYSLIPLYASGRSDESIVRELISPQGQPLARLVVDMDPDEYAAVVGQIPAEGRGPVTQHIQGKLKGRHRAALAAATGEPRPGAGVRRRFVLADYCRQDCVLPMALLRKTGTVVGLLQMSRVTHTSVLNLLTRGQQIKCFSHLYRSARDRGGIMTLPPRITCVLQGATVLVPITGVSTDPVATLDFASLYPNCARDCNICYSTFVGVRDIDDPEPRIPLEDRIDIPTSSRQIVTCVRPHVRPGILPAIETEVLLARKATRRKQKDFAPGSPEHTNLEKRQLALKVTANSFYGVLGVVDGAYSLPPLAAAITARGRYALELTQRLCREEMSDLVGRIMYGDSVVEETPVLCRHRDPDGRLLVQYRRIDQLVGPDDWVDYRDKQQARPQGLEVWSDEGWTPVLHVIRHATDKEIVRVVSPVGFVDVTVDHSMLTELGQEISPRDLVVGGRLMARPLPRLLTDGDSEADVLGGLTQEVVARLVEALGHPWDPADQLGMAQVVLIARAMGRGVHFMEQPDGHFRLEVSSYVAASVSRVYSLGSSPRTVYDLETACHHFAAGPGELVVHNTDSVMVELLVDRDLWAAERPAPGPAGDERRLYPSPGVREAFRLGEELERRLNARIAQVTGQGFLVLEFEQLFDVSCFLSPKRYMGSRWTGVERSCGLYLKGVQSERRDASAPQRDALRGAMGALMYSADPDPAARVEAAVHAVQRALQRFLDGDVAFEDYVMTKSLRDHYKVPNAKGAHLTVVKKMRARAPGSEPKPGNRVPYVICANGRAKSTVSEKAEDPDWAADHDLRPDRVFYAQLMLNGMEQMLDPLLRGGVTVAKVARPYLQQMAAQDSGAPVLGPAPGPIPLITLDRGPVRPTGPRQSKISFAVLPRGPGPHPRPTAQVRTVKRKREAPHPRLQFHPIPTPLLS